MYSFKSIFNSQLILTILLRITIKIYRFSHCEIEETSVDKKTVYLQEGQELCLKSHKSTQDLWKI